MHTLAQTARQRTKRSFGFNVFCLDRLRKLMQLQTANIGKRRLILTKFGRFWLQNRKNDRNFCKNGENLVRITLKFLQYGINN